MATLIPAREIIDGPDFQPELNESEKTLLEALCRTLPSHDWIIYVQPFLNGLNPDFVLFNPKFGITIIEVKDYNYARYEIGDEGVRVRSSPEAPWGKSAFEQVAAYKDALIDFELPFLREQVLLNTKDLYGIVKCAVFFAGYSTEDSRTFWDSIAKNHKRISIIGMEDLLEKNFVRLCKKINQRHHPSLLRFSNPLSLPAA
jgi:hypothetical protein